MNDNTDDLRSVRERFQTFRNRMARDIRMDKLLSGLILVFSVWLCVRIAGRILFIPELETLSGVVLLIGILCTFLAVYRTALDQSTAAYVFDQTHGLDGAFLTFLDLDESNRRTSRQTQLMQALGRRIQSCIAEVYHPSDPSFPAGRAFACVVLLLVGFALPDVSGSIKPSTSPDSTGTNAGAKQSENRKSQAARTNDDQTSGDDHESRRVAKQLLDRFERLKNDTSAENDGAVRRRREALEQDMRSYLRQRQVSSESSDSSGSGQTRSTSGEPDGGGGSTESSTSTATEGEGTPGSTGSQTSSNGNNDGSGSDRSRSEVVDPDRNGASDPLRRIQLALHQLETTTRPSSDLPDREADQIRQPTGTPPGMSPDDASDSLASAGEEESFQLNWSELEASIQRPHRVQSWPPKYDRSISRYRSFLQSYIASRKDNNDAQR